MSSMQKTPRHLSAKQFHEHLYLVAEKIASMGAVSEYTDLHFQRFRSIADSPLLTHINRSLSFWKFIKYFNEKIFSTSNDGLHILVTRRPDEKFKTECLVPTARWGIQVHVWGIISWHGVGPLRVIHGNLKSHNYCIDIIYDIRHLC